METEIGDGDIRTAKVITT